MQLEEFYKILSDNSPRIILSIGIFIIFLAGGKFFKAMILKFLDDKSPHGSISRVIAGIVKNIMVLIGLITALGTMGIDVSAIVAGLGLTGFAFGFAFKDILSNFISGLFIFIYEPFKMGDTIEVAGNKGKVIDLNLRYVTIQTGNRQILIPNSISASKIVIVGE